MNSKRTRHPINPATGQFQTIPSEIRFFESFVPEPNSGCWLWTGQIDKKGYGNFKINKKKVLAHRFSWRFYHGEIPNGKLVCHKCDVRCCVNPNHLFVGSHSDNTKDMWSKNRGFRIYGEINHRSILTESIVMAIRADKRSYAEIAAEYGLSRGHVGKIVRRSLWKHLP